MAGETIGSRAICLSIVPWSRTSHVVSWLAPRGKVTTVAKGAVRPKSWFLGQYDLNYTCDILYYAHGRGDIHALRDCVPVERRDALRDDFRALALAGYFRRLASDFAPQGPDSAAWHDALASALDASGSVTAYITSGYPGKLAGMVDIPVRIGARSDFDKEDAGIILTTNRLADYLRAVNLSRILFERIQQLQMITVIYHVFIITAFGFLLPAAMI